MDLKSQLCEVMPIIEKAAPLVAGMVNKNESKAISLIAGILGLIVNCDPNDREGLAQKLKDDQDLYAKLKKFDETHNEWLKSQW